MGVSNELQAEEIKRLTSKRFGVFGKLFFLLGAVVVLLNGTTGPAMSPHWWTVLVTYLLQIGYIGATFYLFYCMYRNIESYLMFLMRAEARSIRWFNKVQAYRDFTKQMRLGMLSREDYEEQVEEVMAQLDLIREESRQDNVAGPAF